MAEPINGFFKAIVTDTKCFQETGKIKTRISLFNNYFTKKNLLDGYNMDAFKKNLESDKLTYIMMPFGGGNNYGMFKLPPVNSVGLVTFIDGNVNMPVWVGGLASMYYSNNTGLIQMDFPNDNLESEESMMTYNPDTQETAFNIEDINSFIIRTKTNELENLDEPEEMNWNGYTENGLVFSKERMEIIHNNGSGITETIKFSGKDEEDNSIFLSYDDASNEEARTQKSITIDKDKFVINSTDADKNVSISMNDTNIKMKVETNERNTSIEQTKDEIVLKSNDSIITVKRKDNGHDEIVISAPIVRINSDKILLGSTGYKVVVSPGDFDLTLEDGTALTTAQNVSI